MFSLSKVLIGGHSTPSQLWSLWVETDFGAVCIKVGTFKECWQERMNRYNRERGVYVDERRMGRQI